MVVLLDGITLAIADLGDSLPCPWNLNGQLDTCRTQRRRRQQGSGIEGSSPDGIGAETSPEGLKPSFIIWQLRHG
jgi:hypothetical protein